MPCQTDDYEIRNHLQQEANAATRAACDLAQALRYRPTARNNWKDLVSKETVAWVKQHDELDARRLREEAAESRRRALREKGLKKLSRGEREALGLNERPRGRD